MKGRKFDWVEMEERREASRSTENRAGEAWRDQVPDCAACEDATGPPVMVSTLGSLRSHAESDLEWRAAGERG